ncbi:Protein CBG26683 [Caenorhabditis briggsae]|nr:Protein CBG26683 [Caenorhabditis briggsae]CAS01118.1 Protein CBG26683 [Caenorhabditis briggsae]
MANKVYSTEFQRLLREKDEEICSLKKIIEHQDAIIDFVDRKMQEIRLGNEKLFLRNQELEAFYKANSPKNLFQKQPKSPIVMEKVSERLSTNHEMMNKDCADRKKGADKNHINTQRTLVKDAKNESRTTTWFLKAPASLAPV